jgi:hypothetical protein
MVGKMNTKVETYFLSFVGPNYSRSSTLLNFRSPALTKNYTHINPKWAQMSRQLFALRKNLSDSAVLVVMSPSHKATLPAKILTRKKVILDAGWPLTDGVLSRGISINKIPKLLHSFILDLISFHAADIILVESHAQYQRIQRLFAIPKSRLRVSFTGVNESAFFLSNISTIEESRIKNDLIHIPQKLNVLFRGRINKESGIENIIAAAKELTLEANFIFVTGANRILEKIPSNCFLYSEITEAEIKEIYSISDITLGQISRHRRLKYTIPHKAFEAGYFEKVYITPISPSLLELYPDDSVYYLEDASIGNLVSAIRKLRDLPTREIYQRRISEKYKQNSSQAALNSNFEKIVLDL